MLRLTPSRSLTLGALLLTGLLLPFTGRAQSTSFAANTLIVPMDTANQDNGMFVAFGLVQDLLKRDIPVQWAIKTGKNYGDVDFTLVSGADVRSSSALSNISYRGGPFLIDSADYARALPVVQAWQANFAGLTAHRATTSFIADVGRRLLAAPTIGVFGDGNEAIAFSYLNAGSLQQSFNPPTRTGNRMTVGVASAKPTVSAAPAGNNLITGTSTEAAGSAISVFINGLFAGTTTVQAGSVWSFGPAGIPPLINVTATVTGTGKGTSPLSGNRASGNLPAGGTSAAPVITAPLREGDGNVAGTSTEANSTVIKLFRNGALAGTAPVAAGKWSFTLTNPAAGGDIWDASATAPAKTESGLSNFVITVPVPAIVTPPAAAGATSLIGGYAMADGSKVRVYRTRAAIDTLLGTATTSGGAWALTVAAATLVAGDQVYAVPDTFPFPAAKDASAAYACPGDFCCPECLSIAAVKGPSSVNHADGGLLDASGSPRFCQFMSMHYAAPGDPEVVAEVRSFLAFQTHVFLECQAVNAFENDPTFGHYLTSGGVTAAGVTGTGPFFQYGSDSPFAQNDGTYNNPGGSEPSYSLAASSSYYNVNVVHVAADNVVGHGSRDIWMTGYVDGLTAKGKVSYLGGHQYTVALPMSTNPKSLGARYFLDSLFEAPCTSEAVPAVSLTLAGPLYSNGGNATYTINYSSTGVGPLSNLRVSLPLPAGAGFVSSTGGGVLSGSTVVWILGSPSAGASGTLTVTVSFGPDGLYSFQGSGTWTAGATAKSVLSNIVTTTRDTVAPAAPTITAPANGSSTTSTTPAISGTAEANSTVTLTITGPGGPYTVTTTADASGNYSVPSPALPQGGPFSVSATARDAAGNTSVVSGANSFNVIFVAPALTGPINAGTSAISGTSSAPNGTIITVYKNGAPIGTTTVSGGSWTLSGVSGLIGGESITATTGTGVATSAASTAIIVTPAAPVMNSPLVAGQTAITGSSTAPVGSTVTVVVNGTPYTTTVLAGGTWSVTVPALVAGSTVSSTVTANGQTSAGSTSQTVIHQTPSITSPIYPTDSSISGSSAAPDGTAISIYKNGVFLGSTTVTGGVWTLAGISGLAGNDQITARVGTGATTSALSAPVSVANLPGLLRSTQGSLNPTAATFPRAPGDPSLSRSGLVVFLFNPSASYPQETTDYSDQTTPIVFYQLEANSGNTLAIAKDKLNGKLVISY